MTGDSFGNFGSFDAAGGLPKHLNIYGEKHSHKHSCNESNQMRKIEQEDSDPTV